MSSDGLITELLYKTLSFNSRTARCNGRSFSLMIADTTGKKMLGLMHRKGLKDSQGMLFSFGSEGRHDIWMLNMKFSIDILWLDKKLRVLKIVRNAEPCRSLWSCAPYASPSGAVYVIELKAGASKKNSIAKGSRFVL